MTTLMRILFIIIALSNVLTFPVMAQKISVEPKNENQVQLVSNRLNSTVIDFTIKDFNKNKVKVKGQDAFTITLDEGSPLLQKGTPDLSKLTASVIVSETEDMEVTVVHSEYKEYYNIRIAPSKGNLYRNQDPNKIPYEYGKVYGEDAFFPGKLAEIRKPYILREFRGQTVIVYPLQYNPVTMTLRVYSSITVEVKSSGKKGLNSMEKAIVKKGNSEFQQLYKRHFLNFDAVKYAPVDESGNFLIISPSKYYNAVKPLSQWKNKRGLPTEIVEYAASTTGTGATNLFNYLKTYYQEKGITYLLLVGDANDIPSLNASGDSDVAYSYMAGNDSYPEYFVGRLSGSNELQIENQVEKAIYYERDIDETATWLSNALVIASAEGGNGQGDDGESDIEHMENIKTDLLAYTYTTVFTAFDPGATSSEVSNAVNGGVSNINYVGHGSDTYWVTTGFDVNDCNNLTNYGKFPFIFDVACVNGNFHNQTCFAEGFVQARKNNQPTGALAILASTINQSWDPPMDGQDEMIDILVESYENNIKRTFSGIAYNGCLHMNDEYGSDGDEMTDTWTTFGDPSVFVRTATPVAMEVSFNEELLIGTTSFEVTCNTEGAIVCLSHQNTIVDAVTVKNGLATLNFEPFTDIADLDLVFTGFNRTTFQSVVKVIPAEGPYIAVSKVLINDKLTNNNGQPDNGETIFIDAQIKNVGVEDAEELKVMLTSSDDYLQILQAEHFYGTLKAGSVTGNSTLRIKVKDSVPNMHPAHFTLTFTDINQHVWEKELSFVINAPLLQLKEPMLVEDGTWGDGNGKLEPGESGFISLFIENKGNNLSGPAEIRWILSTPYITADEPVTKISSLEAGQVSSTLLKITTSLNTPNGTKAQIDYDWANVDSLTNSLDIIVGQPPLIEFGEGTIKKYQYPFYNYYKSNKTQMLFLTNEFSSGNHLINELAFNLASFTQNAKHRKLKNFTLILGTTSANQIGNSYLTLEHTDTVMYSDSLELAQSIGWFGIEIEPYLYNTANGNLVVEIYWGINDSYCSSTDRTSVFCTETPLSTVAYGYADNEYPSAFDGANNLRPNVKFSFIDQNLKLDTLDIVIIDALGEPVSDAQVIFGSERLFTNDLGKVSKILAFGEYLVSVSKQGYKPLNQSVVLNEFNTNDTLTLISYEEFYQVTFKVADNETAIEEAWVYFVEQHKTTNSLGEALFEEIPGESFPCKIEAEGYQSVEQWVAITSDTVIHVILNKIPTVLVSFSISENGNPLQGVNILFNNDLQVTSANGIAQFTGVSKEASRMYYIEKWGYYSVSDTLEPITGDLEVSVQLVAIPDLLVQVTNKFGDMEKAKVMFQGQNIYSNADGQAHFADIEPGFQQELHIESQGFYSLDSLVDISMEGNEFSFYLFKKTDVTLHITDGSSALKGIPVSLGGIEKTTDSLGVVRFNDNTEANMVPLTINTTGYYPMNLSFDFIKDLDMDSTLILEFIPDVEFQVMEKGIPVSGATLLFNNTEWISNSEGKIHIPDVVKGDYTYSFNQTGYYAIQKNLTVALLDILEVIEIKTIPDIKLTVTSNEQPVSGASVTLDTLELLTNTDGSVNFVDVIEGTYNYSITKAGYLEKTGTITVSAEDVLLTIDLVFVSVNNQTANTILIYPNPSKGVFTLKSQNISFGDYFEILNNKGEIIFKKSINSLNQEVNVTPLPKGIYVIRVHSGDVIYLFKQIFE